MKAEYINPFIRSARSVINSLLGIDAELGKIYLRSEPFLYNQVVIMIGFIGKIKGQVYFELSKETAKKIASVMMGGINITELDEISKSALAEMGNMIMGNSCMIFAEEKINIDITPPSLLTGEKIEISNKVSTIIVPLDLREFGTLNINVSAVSQ